MIENSGAILRADVGPLSIQGCWIVVRPENVENLLVTDLSRIEFHFNNFCVAGFIRAHIYVSGIFFRTTGIANSGRRDTLQVPESLFHPPKTSRAECRFLCRHHE